MRDGPGSPRGSSPASLKSEKAYLIYPIGRIDADPEKLIPFHGVSPQAAMPVGHEHHRALVTIAFLELDDRTNRKLLFKQRARVINFLFTLLLMRERAQSEAERKQWQEKIQQWQEKIQLNSGPSSPHTNCAKCFVQLFENPATRPEAEALDKAATEYLASVSP